MGIVDSLSKTAQAMGAATAIHQHSKYLYNQAKTATGKQPCTSCKDKLVMVLPKTGQVNEWIRLRGISPPGIVNIYSSALHERTVIPNPTTGLWYTTLRFSVPGEYRVIAKNGDLEAEDIIQIA